MNNPWCAFYWPDYLADTGHLSLSEHGAYLLLMAHYYITGKPLPGDVGTICRLARVSPHPRHASHVALQSVLDKFFRLDTTSPSSPVYRHKRIDKELRIRERISNEYKARAKKGAEARWSKERAEANATSNATSNAQAMLGGVYLTTTTTNKEQNPMSKPPVSDLEREREQIVIAVWNYYVTTIGRNPKLYTLTPKRKRMGMARIRDLWPRAAEPKQENVTELMTLCVDRLKASAFHNGDNNRRKKYLDWEILFRSTEQMEKWLNSDEGARQ